MPGKRQGRLFSGPQSGSGGGEALSLNVRGRLKEALRRTCKESRFSRAQIADRMNARAVVEGLDQKRRVTLAAIEAWLAPGKPNLPDADLIPLFCWAAEGDDALEALAGSRGFRLIGGEEARLLAWAEKTRQMRQLQRQIRQLEPEV